MALSLIEFAVSYNVIVNRLNVLIYDSGIGGINLLIDLERSYPQINYYYMSDSDFFPYGDKPLDELLMRAEHNLRVVRCEDYDAVILACNTLSTNCLERLSSRFKGVKFFGVVPPSIDDCSLKTLVLCTNATKLSTYIMKAKSVNKNLACVSLQDLVSRIEKSPFDLSKIELDKYVLPELERQTKVNIKNFDKVVLGCTHFCFLREGFEQVFDSSVVTDGFEVVIDKFQGWLTTFWGNAFTCDHQGEVRFIFSDIKRNFWVFKEFFKRFKKLG